MRRAIYSGVGWYVNGRDLRPGSQVTQQPVERLQVGVVVFPVGEIPDVAGVLEQRRPAGFDSHRRVVNNVGWISYDGFNRNYGSPPFSML